MADFTITITNGVRLFGQGPSTKWGDVNGVFYTMVWGTSVWSEGGFTLVHDIQKLIANSVTQDTIIINDVIHYLEIGTLTIDSTIINDANKFISNDLTMSEDLSSEKLSQNVWEYVFPPGVTENENRIITSFSCGSAQTTSYTCQAIASTTWS